MEQIKAKIKELLDLSAVDVNWDGLSEKMKKQELLMDELVELAKAKNTLLGRTIKFPHADSHALYIITKVNKKTVQLEWVNWCDAWVDDRCGKRCSLDLRYATQHVKGEDAMAEIFGKRQKEIV